MPCHGHLAPGAECLRMSRTARQGALGACVPSALWGTWKGRPSAPQHCWTRLHNPGSGETLLGRHCGITAGRGILRLPSKAWQRKTGRICLCYVRSKFRLGDLIP